MEDWIRATHAKYRERYGLELAAIASYGLDDTGDLSIRTGPGTTAPFTYAEIASKPAGLISPFTAEVIRTFKPGFCGLPHWARLKLQSHNGLKVYFRNQGLLLISSWALLADSSPKKVRQCWEIFGAGSLTADQAIALHAAYKAHHKDAKRVYVQLKGKSSGWIPDPQFLKLIAPNAAIEQTMANLQAMADAIRKVKSGQWQRSGHLEIENEQEIPDPTTNLIDESSESADLRQPIDLALERAMQSIIPVWNPKKKPVECMRCLLHGYSEELSTRRIGDRCGCSQSQVSLRLQPNELAKAIATAAAQDLKRHGAFAAVSQSVEGAERLVAALRNHLLEPEREGDVALLRRWIQQYLNQP